MVTRKRRIALGKISALRISFATVFQHGTFWAKQLSVHPRSTVRFPAGLMDRPDSGGPRPFLRPNSFWKMAPIRAEPMRRTDSPTR